MHRFIFIFMAFGPDTLCVNTQSIVDKVACRWSSDWIVEIVIRAEIDV